MGAGGQTRALDTDEGVEGAPCSCAKAGFGDARAVAQRSLAINPSRLYRQLA